MKAILKKIFVFTGLIIVLASCSVSNPITSINEDLTDNIFERSEAVTPVYYNNLDTLPLGAQVESAFKTAMVTRYVKGISRISVTSTSSNVYSGRAIQIKYPKGMTGTSNSGATWETDIKTTSEDMYMSYWVKFKSDFDFRSGGKLPGLGGSESFPYGANGFSSRLMWREGGTLEFYLHGYNMTNKYGEEPYRIWWNYDAKTGTTPYTYYDGKPNNSAKVVAGKWHHIEIRVKMNTPGQKNGLLQGWLDGVMVCNDTDSANMRAAGQTSTKINHLFFATFFGGSSDIIYQPLKDEYAYFDEFKVSTARLGYPGAR